jgi:ABC transporter DrrB family efflux protein
VREALSDTVVIAQRNLRRIPRAPDLLIAFTAQPVMFILLFAYVFGGAIETPGYDDYIDFLMPGIVVQALAFGGFVTAVGLADDLSKGLIDRFRSLPMSRAAVLAGRTLADVATNAVQLVVLIVVGLLIGFTFDASAPEILAGVALLLLFGYAFSWVFAWCALVASSAESAQTIGFMVIFPLSFASSAFVPVDSMPGWLEAFAEVNPFTTTTDALRALWVDAPAGDDVWLAFIWCAVITAVFATMSVARYRRAVTR